MNRKLGTALGATSCIATLLATAMPGLAQPKMDELSVSYGVFKGSLGVICALAKEGLLPNHAFCHPFRQIEYHGRATAAAGQPSHPRGAT